MSLGIGNSYSSFTDSFVEFISKHFTTIREAETKGKRDLVIESNNKSRYSNSTLFDDLKKYKGQVIHWVTDSSIIPIRKPWKFIDVEKISESKLKIVLQRIEEKYYNQLKEHHISHRDLVHLSDTEYFGMLKPGTLLIDERGRYGKIADVVVEEEQDNDLTHKNDLNNPHNYKIMRDVVKVLVYEEETEGRFRATDVRLEEEAEKYDLSKFENRWTILRESTFEEFEIRIRRVREEQVLVGLEDTKLIGDNSGAGSTSLVGFNSKDQLMVNRSQLRERSEQADAIASGIRRDIAIKREAMEHELAIQERKMEMILGKAHELTVKVKSEVGKIENLVTTLEIYAGVNENVLQIKKGNNAPESTPISIRSQVLYMDEEVAVTADQGLDFSTIHLFDEWVTNTPGALESLLPEIKGVVLLRPRRHMKERDSLPPMLAAELEKLDKQCYVLIRNGGNVYRVWTNRIEIQTQLLPDKEEIQGIFDKIYDVEKRKAQYKVDSYEWRQAEEELEKLESHVMYYKRILILLQGIVVRTEIFRPLPPKLNLLDISTHGDMINFIYDHEFILGDGRPSFREWQAESNTKLVKGQRIYFVSENCPGANSDPDRFSLQWQHDSSAPPLPNSGVYTLKEGEDITVRTVLLEVPRAEYEAEAARWKAVVKKYTSDKLIDGSVKTVVRIPKDEYKGWKYDPAESPKYYKTTKGLGKPTRQWHHRDEDDEPKLVETDHDGKNKKIWDIAVVEAVDPNRLEESYRHFSNKDGDKTYEYRDLKETVVTKCFKISYNPKDTVYLGWGKSTDEGDYQRERKSNITMKIYKDDGFILNYDAMLLEDVDYYLNDRQHRAGYLSMMPVLRGIKEALIKEQAEEKQFVDAMVDRLSVKIGDAVPTAEIRSAIWSRVKWWKDELVTVWKRPLSKDEGKAWSTIELHATRDLQKDNKIDLGATLDNRKKTLVMEIRRRGIHHMWVGTGFHKSQFVDKLWEDLEFSHVNAMMDYSKHGVLKRVAVTDNQEFVTLASMKPGEIFYQTK